MIYRQELKRALRSKSFLLVVLLGCILTTIQAVKQWNITFQWDSTCKELGIWEYFGNSAFNVSFGHNELYWTYNYFYMYIILLATTAYACSYYFDIKSGYANNVMSRLKKRTDYYKAKYLAVFIAGGLTVAIPLLWNIFLLTLVVPLQNVAVESSLQAIHFSTFIKIYYDHTWLYFLIFIGVAFLLCGAYATISLTVSLFSHFLFTIWATPFLISLILYNVAQYKHYLEIAPFIMMSPNQTAPFEPKLFMMELGLIFLITFIPFCLIKPRRDML